MSSLPLAFSRKWKKRQEVYLLRDVQLFYCAFHLSPNENLGSKELICASGFSSLSSLKKLDDLDLPIFNCIYFCDVGTGVFQVPNSDISISP